MGVPSAITHASKQQEKKSEGDGRVSDMRRIQHMIAAFVMERVSNENQGDPL